MVTALGFKICGLGFRVWVYRVSDLAAREH